MGFFSHTTVHPGFLKFMPYLVRKEKESLVANVNRLLQRTV